MKRFFKLSNEYMKEINLPDVEKIDNIDEIWTFVILDRHIFYNTKRKYIISNYGRIIDITKKKIVHQFDSNKSNADGESWKRVHLYYDTTVPRGMKYSVHRLVALAFIENDDPINKNVVNHKDGHPNNNFVNNLEWCTLQENVDHANKNGLIKHMKRGEDRKTSVFTNDDVHIVCHLMESGYKAKAIYNILLELSDNPNITLERVKSLYKHIRYMTHWKEISRFYNIDFKELSH